MIALLYIQALAAGFVLAIAALAAERAVRLLRLPTRAVWLGALTLSAALTYRSAMNSGALQRAMHAARGTGEYSAAAPAGTGAITVWARGTVATRPQHSATPAMQARDAWATWTPRVPKSWTSSAFDRPLLVMWGVLSAAMLALVAGVSLRVSAAVQRARGARLLGAPVLVSETMGPAAVGVGTPRIVIPEWVLSVDSARQRMILLHEQEHARAFDPALLLAATLLVALAPWNPAGWYMLRRLQRAIEIDCDQRVLRANTELRSYVSLLLDVGSAETSGLLPALGRGGRSSLVRARVLEMVRRRPAHARLKAGASSVAAVAALLVACRAPAVRVAESAPATVPAATPAGTAVATTSTATRPTTSSSTTPVVASTASASGATSVASAAATASPAGRASSTAATTLAGSVAVAASGSNMVATSGVSTTVQPGVAGGVGINGARAVSGQTIGRAETAASVGRGVASAATVQGATTVASAGAMVAGGVNTTVAGGSARSGIANTAVGLGAGSTSAVALSATTVSPVSFETIDAVLAKLMQRYYPKVAARNDAVPAGGMIIGFVLANRDSVIATTTKPLDGRGRLDHTDTMRELFPGRTYQGAIGGLSTFFRPGAVRSDRRVVIAWSSLTPF